VATQVVVEGLHVGEDALGVWLLPHDHHVFHLHQGHAVHQRPAETQPSAQPLAGCPTAGASTGDQCCPGPAAAGHRCLQPCSAPACPLVPAVLLLLALGRVHAACNRGCLVCTLCHPGALCPSPWCWQSPSDAGCAYPPLPPADAGALQGETCLLPTHVCAVPPPQTPPAGPGKGRGSWSHAALHSCLLSALPAHFPPSSWTEALGAACPRQHTAPLVGCALPSFNQLSAGLCLQPSSPAPGAVLGSVQGPSPASVNLGGRWQSSEGLDPPSLQLLGSAAVPWVGWQPCAHHPPNSS